MSEKVAIDLYRCSVPPQSQRSTGATHYCPTLGLISHAALPFAFSTDEAIVRLGPFLAVASGRLHNMLRSALARWLPFFGSEPLRPVEILAIYLPGWFVDAEVEGRLETTLRATVDPQSEMAKRQIDHVRFSQS